MILAHGDCARSPNFFSSSGVNIGVKGLETIGKAWMSYHDPMLLEETVTKLNLMGEELNNHIIEGHKKQFSGVYNENA